MKKLALTTAIILGMTFGAFAQQSKGGGLLGYGYVSEQEDWGTTNWNTTQEWLRNGGLLTLPTTHGSGSDYSSPLGSGALLLIGFGAAYALKKRRK